MRPRTLLFLALALASSALLCHGQGVNPALHKVKRIHVAQMGSGAEAERFHGLLEDELRRVGFDVTGETGDADAILTGEFSAEVHGDRSQARATVQLKSPYGKRTLWSGDYISQHKGEGHEDVVKSVAENCADRLRKDWEKG
jgi:3-hydroxy-3-methylglutaryl CoA synthase